MNKFRYIIVIFFVLTVTSNLFSQKRKEKKTHSELPTKVNEAIERQEYKLVADMAYPIIGRLVPLLDDRYNLEIKGDSVFSCLPYYGRAYNIPYGGGEGLIFKSTITNYKYKKGRKNSVVVSFNSQTKEDYYSFVLTFYPAGGSYISVSSNNRQGIGFSAEIAKKEDKKNIQ